ncbi:hypothetical protein AGOR_G00043190 [Albula goreensis]|uniref:Lymphocyte antigen 96 n=1 Tax=Albula goreensis TaxID=1534307 RepID=A0A8T3DY94_9TELE|nr:hypothetical protein AGOR_G00043190 [Albula goreensis]
MLRILFVLNIIFVCGYGERRLACSSKTGELWYTCKGEGFNYISFNVEPCLQMQSVSFTLSYTIIPMKKLQHLRFKAHVWFENQLVVDFYVNDVFCEDNEVPDVKLCELVKGETLSDSIYFVNHRYPLTKGKYDMILRLTDGTGHDILTCDCTATIK